MLFSSITFLYYFLPVVLLVYFITPKFLKNTVLLLFSLVFYGWGEPRYVFLMIATVGVGYVTGLLIEKYRDKNNGRKQLIAKISLWISVAFGLGALAYFKYADFFIENFNRVTGLSTPLLKIALPIGISFYTFQILSYSIDVYRGNVPAQKNLINLACYVALFPQLIAGPIVRYSDIAKQLESRTHSFDKAAEGIRRFIFGLGKKIILANTFGELCAAFGDSGDKSVAFYWLYAVAYMLQVYFDFSGYSDMAIGLGKILGFDFMENFNYPFVSASITDFWRRWHISLGSWFRDYVYIPLGGNRVNRGKMLFNIFTVWFLTGFWHGAEWNFIVWGLFFGVLLTLEKFFFANSLKRHKIMSHIYVLFFVAISFVIFSGNSLADALDKVGGLFGMGGIPAVSAEFFYYFRSYGVVFAVGIIAATPLMKTLTARVKAGKRGEAVLNVLEIPFLLAILLVATAFLADGSFNPFLYFRF